MNTCKRNIYYTNRWYNNCCSRSSLFQYNVRSIRTMTFLSNKRFVESDIEDLGDLKSIQKKNTLTTRKKNVLNESFFSKVQRKKWIVCYWFPFCGTGFLCSYVFFFRLVWFCWIYGEISFFCWVAWVSMFVWYNNFVLVSRY